MRSIPFYCVKGVSDGFSDNLPDFNRFISPSGQFQLGRFTLYALSRPWHWPGLIKIGENSKRAAQSIAVSLLELLDERGHIRKLNGYPNLQS
jgi:adenosylhomocysteine nucleosidase